MQTAQMIQDQTANQAPLPESWMSQIGDEFQKPYMHTLRSFLAESIKQGKTIYPHGSEIFTAFKHTPFDQVKVVIIGQDPYHGPGQAHGLCFSVKPGVRPPPSLVNIYKEIETELGIAKPNHGYLIGWADQGVLLLNTVLTVEKGSPASHQGKGWEQFTDRVVALLNEQKEHLVFILWGSHAQKKGVGLNRKKHLVLESAHPSPFSVHRGFFGNGHFLKTNLYLEDHGHRPIDWSLPQLH